MPQTGEVKVEWMVADMCACLICVTCCGVGVGGFLGAWLFWCHLGGGGLGGGGRHLPSGLWGTLPFSPGPWLLQCSQPQRTQLLPDAMPAPWFSQPLEQGGV